MTASQGIRAQDAASTSGTVDTLPSASEDTDACPTSCPDMNRHVGLTPRQSRFVSEYLIDLSATNAAIRAGYGAHSADTVGPRLVRKSGVAAAIECAIAERVERTNVSQDSVIAELATIAFSDLRMYAHWGPLGVFLKDSALLTAGASCVAELNQTHSAGGGSLKIRLHDKVRALELLGRHLGLFGTPDLNGVMAHERSFVVLGGQRIFF